MVCYASDETAYGQLVRRLKAMGEYQLTELKSRIETEESGHPDQEYTDWDLEGKVSLDEFWEALLAELESRQTHIISC